MEISSFNRIFRAQNIIFWLHTWNFEFGLESTIIILTFPLCSRSSFADFYCTLYGFIFYMVWNEISNLNSKTVFKLEISTWIRNFELEYGILSLNRIFWVQTRDFDVNHGIWFPTRKNYKYCDIFYVSLKFVRMYLFSYTVPNEISDFKSKNRVWIWYFEFEHEISSWNTKFSVWKRYFECKHGISTAYMEFLIWTQKNYNYFDVFPTFPKFVYSRFHEISSLNKMFYI